MPKRVFISHSSADKGKIKQLALTLIDLGFPIFIDSPSVLGWNAEFCEARDVAFLRSGEWGQQLRDAVRDCGAVLGCLSSNLTDDRRVWQEELQVGETHAKLVLCKIDDVAPEAFAKVNAGTVQIDRLQMQTVSLQAIEPTADVADETIERISNDAALSFVLKDLKDLCGPLPVPTDSEAKMEDWNAHEICPTATKAWKDKYERKVIRSLSKLSRRAWATLEAEVPGLGSYPETDQHRRQRLLQLLSAPSVDVRVGISAAVNVATDEDEHEDANKLRDLLFLLAPVHTDEESTRFIAWARSADGKYSLKQVAGSPTKAEKLAAGIDGAGMSLQPRQNEGDLPAGPARIPYPPRGGIDPDGRGYIAAICDFLSSTIDDGELADDVEGYLKDELVDQSASMERLRKVLKNRKRIGKDRSFYLTVPAEAMLEEHQRARLISALSTLMERLPEIQILAINVELADDDYDEVAALAFASPIRAGRE